MRTRSGQYWHSSTLSPLPFYSDNSIYEQAVHLFKNAPSDIREIGVHCYQLSDYEVSQLSIFADEIARERHRVVAIDELNHRYGEHTIHSADTLNLGITGKTKIPFGSTRFL